MIGILFAYLGVKWLVAAAGALIPRSELVSVDGTVLLFTLAVSCLTGIAFASLPAFTSSRAGLNEVLKSGGRAGASGHHGHGRSLLVASEIALALILLAGAGLLVRSFWHVLNIEMGYTPEHVLTAEIPDEGSPSQNPNFLPDLLSRMKLVPGVQAVGAARTLPLAFDPAPMQAFDIVGGPPPGQGEIREAVVGVATPGYFPAMRIALRRGRLFDNRDAPKAPNVALVNEAFVRRYFPIRTLSAKLWTSAAPCKGACRETWTTSSTARRKSSASSPTCGDDLLPHPSPRSGTRTDSGTG